MKFQTDYLISWDFTTQDCPVVILSRLSADGNKIITDMLAMEKGTKSGIISLRQALDEYEREYERKKERHKNAKELIKTIMEKGANNEK